MLNRELDLPSLGRRIAEIRREQRWSQSQLAISAGIRPERLSRLELGRVAEPRLWDIACLARALNGGLEELVFGREGEGSEGAGAPTPAGPEGSGA